MYNNRRTERSTDNGLLYPVVRIVIKVIFYLNMVELFKILSDYFTGIYFRRSSDRIKWIKKRRNRNIVIDLFIILKYCFLIYLLWNDLKLIWFQLVVWYLLITNTFTYFYYHLWIKDALLETNQTIHRVRRRFINLFVSILFMILCYSYIYQCLIPEVFILDTELNPLLASSLKSVAESFAIDFDGLKSISDIGVLVETSQVVNIFIFITLILAKSLPKANQE